MIKNIAAAAALGLSTALITCAPAQAAAAPHGGSSYPWPPYGYVLLAPAPLRPAPVQVQPTDRGWFAYAPLVVADTRG